MTIKQVVDAAEDYENALDICHHHHHHHHHHHSG